MLDLFAAADSFLRQPTGWLAILLVVIVVWLIRVVIDLRSDLTLMKQSSAHNLTASFLAQYSNNSHRRQLHRIRNAARRAAKSATASANPADALHRFEREIQAEINTLEASFGPESPAHANDDEDPDSAFSSSSAGEDDDDSTRVDDDDVDPLPDNGVDEADDFGSAAKPGLEFDDDQPDLATVDPKPSTLKTTRLRSSTTSEYSLSTHS